MSTPLFAFPFRLTPAGVVATQEDDSDEYHAGELAVLMLTHVGERELVPDYGVTDPTFYQFDEVEFVERAAMFVPQVRITRVLAPFTGETQQEVQVEFDTVDVLQDDPYDDTTL